MAKSKASLKIVDMTNVKDGGRRFNTKRVMEGDYLARVSKVEDAEAKSDGAFQWLFTISLEKGSGTYPYYCKLQENQLWKIRNLLIAAGMNVPKKKLKLDPEKVVGKLIGVTMEDDEYEGKMKSVVAAVFPPSELEGEATDDDDEDETDDDDTDEEETPPPAKKKKAKVAEPEEEEEEAEEEAPKKKKKKAKPVEVEEDEDEEEEAPAPKAKKKKKRTISDEELEELDIDEV